MSVAGAPDNKVDHVSHGPDGFLIEAFDVNSLFDILADVKILFMGIKKVHNLLVVDLKVRALDQVLDF